MLRLRLMSASVSRPVKWTICAVAAMGFLFDIYVVLVGPLILQPALTELGHLKPGTPEYRDWAGYLFWIPPLVGGFCGLWGGYLADRFGRRRILTYSILIYAFSATASGLAASVESLLLFRTLSFAGTCVEFVAAVAWLAELFPNPRTREAVLGYTQAFCFARRRPYRRSVLCRESLGPGPASHLWKPLRLALRIDRRCGARHSPRHHPSVPSRVSAMGAPAHRGHSKAPQRARALQSRIPPRDYRHRAAVRLRLWRGVRHHPAIATNHAGLAGGGAIAARCTRASDFERARNSGDGRPGRTHCAGGAGPDRRQPSPAAAYVPDPRPRDRSGRVPLHGDAQPGNVPHRHLLCGIHHGGATHAFGAIIFRASILSTCAELAKDSRPTSADACSAPRRRWSPHTWPRSCRAASPSARLTHAATVVGIGVYALALGLTFLLPEPPAELPE